MLHCSKGMLYLASDGNDRLATTRLDGLPAPIKSLGQTGRGVQDFDGGA
jgi:hypothetical protein